MSDLFLTRPPWAPLGLLRRPSRPVAPSGGPGPRAPVPLFSLPPGSAGPSVFPAMAGWGGAADRPTGSGLASVTPWGTGPRAPAPISPTPSAQAGPVFFPPWQGEGVRLPSPQGLVWPASPPGGLAHAPRHLSLPPLLAHVGPAIFPPLWRQAQIQKVLLWWVIAPWWLPVITHQAN